MASFTFPLGSDVRIPLSNVALTALDGTVAPATMAAVVTGILYGANAAVLIGPVALTWLVLSNWAWVIDKGIFAGQLPGAIGSIQVTFAEAGADAVFNADVYYTQRGTY